MNLFATHRALITIQYEIETNNGARRAAAPQGGRMAAFIILASDGYPSGRSKPRIRIGYGASCSPVADVVGPPATTDPGESESPYGAFSGAQSG